MSVMTSDVSPPRRYADGAKARGTDSKRRLPGAGTIWKRIIDNKDPFVKIGMAPDFATVVNRLHLYGVLTVSEKMAAWRYGEILGRHDRYHGLQRRQMATPAYDRGFGREDEVVRHEAQGTIKAYERRARQARKDWSRIQKVVPESAKHYLDEVCVYDREINSNLHDDLKRVLGRISKEFGILEPKQEEPKAPSVGPHTAQFLLDRLEKWFGDQGFRVAEFAMLPDLPNGQVGIMAYSAPNEGGTVVKHAISLHPGKLLPEAVLAMLLKAAEKKGWAETKLTNATSV